jgi:hypothetical protein
MSEFTSLNCPICNHNDRATKLSALAKAVNRPQIDLRYPVQPSALEFVPCSFPYNYEGFQISRFVPRAKPRKILTDELKANYNWFFITGMALWGVPVLAIVFSGIDRIGAIILVLFTWCLFTQIPFVVYVLNKTQSNNSLARIDAERGQNFCKQEKEKKQDFLQAEAERKKAFEQEEAQRKKAFEQTEAKRMQVETPRWENAVTRWDRSYYCERDDIVFIPGTNECESSDKLQQFLYRTR